jgi:biotin carboxyl carrier protein
MDLGRIEAILRLLDRQEYVGEVSIQGDGWRVQARRRPGIRPHPPAPPELPEPAEEGPEQHFVRAGMVGVYRAPDKPLRPGDFLPRGATAGSIDSMRILNPIAVEEGGYVVSASVEDGDPVEYGQELFALVSESPGLEGEP